MEGGAAKNILVEGDGRLSNFVLVLALVKVLNTPFSLSRLTTRSQVPTYPPPKGGRGAVGPLERVG